MRADVLRSHSSLSPTTIGYAEYINPILSYGGQVAIIGFREEVAPDLAELIECGLEFLDLEYDLGAFNVSLRRPYHPDWT